MEKVAVVGIANLFPGSKNRQEFWDGLLAKNDSRTQATVDQIVFVGTKPPVSFFAYPDKPSILSPEGATLLRLADKRTDAEDTLRRLADALDAPDEPAHVQETSELPEVDDGPLDQRSLGIIAARLMPENAIVSDEGALLQEAAAL